MHHTDIYRNEAIQDWELAKCEFVWEYAACLRGNPGKDEPVVIKTNAGVKEGQNQARDYEDLEIDWWIKKGADSF